MEKTRRLTPKQAFVLETVERSVRERGVNPNAYQIHKDLALHGRRESVKGVCQVLDALERKGTIARDEDRRILLVENDAYADLGNIFSLPVYGLASCGEALAYAEDNVDGYLQVSKSLFRESAPATLFAVKALGDSMDLDGINDGDYVIFEKCADGDMEYDGKIVVAVINGMATIKRYRRMPPKKDGVIGLFPHSNNRTHQPIYIHESDAIIIAGVFRKVLPIEFTSL